MKPDLFFLLVGQITLIHAGIEQDLKGILIEDWNIPEIEVEKNYGHRLRTFFLKNAKKQSINEEYYNKYIRLIDRFWTASEKRNELIKANYSITENTGEIFKHDTKARGKYDPEINFQEWWQKGIKEVTYEETLNLKNELGKIRESTFQLSKKNHLEKKALEEYAQQKN